MTSVQELETVFKSLIILTVVIVGATFTVALFGPDDEKYFEQGLSPVVYFGAFVNLLKVPTWILLYRFIPWGRPIFTILTALSVIVMFLAPEYFVPKGPIFDALKWMNGAVTGAILAMLYLTEIKERFVR